MADNPQSLASLTPYLAVQIRDEIVKAYNRRAPLMRVFPSRATNGQNSTWEWESDAALVETFADGADVVNYGSDLPHIAALNWANYRANFRLTDLARAAARASGGPGALVNLWAHNMVNSISKMASVLNKDAYSGPGGNALTGLDTALDNANTYAGVDRTLAGNAGFRSTVIDPGTPTAVTLGLIRDDLRVIYELSGEMPKFAIVNPTTYNKVGALFDNQRFYMVDILSTARGEVRLDASIGGIIVEGCTFLRDKDATAGRIYYLNPDSVAFAYVPQDNAADPPDTVNRPLDDGYGPIPLGMKFKHLATTGASEKASGQIFLQLNVLNPFQSGVRKNVA